MFVYQGASDLDMFVWLLILMKTLCAVMFSSLATKWIRYEVWKNYCKLLYWNIYGDLISWYLWKGRVLFFGLWWQVALCSPVICIVHIRNNILGNCQLKFLKFSLEDFYDFKLTSWHTCVHLYVADITVHT